MTVTDLIEKLKALHGDPDLRHVALRVVVCRPYAADATFTGSVRDVCLDRGEAQIEGSVYVE